MTDVSGAGGPYEPAFGQRSIAQAGADQFDRLRDEASGLPDKQPLASGSRSFTIGSGMSEIFGCLGELHGFLVLFFAVFNIVASLAVLHGFSSGGIAVVIDITAFSAILFLGALVEVIRQRAKLGSVSAGPVAAKAFVLIPRSIAAFLTAVVAFFLLMLPLMIFFFVIMAVTYGGLAAIDFAGFVSTVGILGILITIIGIVVTLVFLLRFALLVPLVMFEQRYFAFRRSAELTKGKRWQLVGFYVVAGILSAAASTGASALSLFQASGLIGQLAVILSGSLIASAGGLVIAMVPMVAYQLMKEEKEGGETDHVAGVFA